MHEPSPAGTVLVVEDDPMVREMAREMFADLGCRVLDTYNASLALQMIRRHPDIRLVFADVRMPGAMNGVDLAKAVRAVHPSLRVVLTSGIQPDDLDGIEFLPKPWNPREIRTLLQPRQH
jgi:CheY-like chemotaxis protein